MHVVSLIVLLQSIRLCAARPVDLQPATLATNADEMLTPQDVVKGFEDWFKPKPTVKYTKESTCGDDSEKCDQCASKPNSPLDMGEISDSGKLDQKVNGAVSKDTEGNGKSNGKPKAGSNEESSHKSNDTKTSLELHDINCFGRHQFGKHKDIYHISQQNYAGFACPETESKMIKKGDNRTFISYQRWIYGAPYLYNVYWKDGCELKNGKTEQDVTDPLEEGYKPEAPSYFKILSLNYLYNANIIYTDIHSDNLLVALTDDSILSTVEDSELYRPSARKFLDGAVIHVSQYMLGGAGALTICDLGQARIGKLHRGNAMPLPYRAPEVILGMTWGNSVDVWSVGLLAWDLLHKKGIFRVYDESGEFNDAHHLAAMTALLGQPPDIFLRRSDKTRKYWDAEGRWHGPVPLPEGALKSLETNLCGIDRDQFLDLLAGTLTWLPEDRLNSAEAYFHLWLRRETGVE
ncbi:serine/threonine protein kinase [Fusarium proliferatum]|uniref:Serine/threonine protein kinase n=1 Tax=Gibberella intermedia TaxID=948311 RepID=A0A365NCB7_GIBIN|nr:serine/threonine protein kinase [Fusarium proliferatum]